MDDIESGKASMTDVKVLLTYAKCFLIAAYFVFICGNAITLTELFEFVADESERSEWLTAAVLLILGAVSFLGLWGAFREDSCLLMAYSAAIFVVFALHVVLLFHLKRACTDQKKKCLQNLATPPGIAPILVAISELAIAVCAFFMALVIESEKMRRREEGVRRDSAR